MAGVYCCWVLGILAQRTRGEAAGHRAAFSEPVPCCLHMFGANLPSHLSCPEL